GLHNEVVQTAPATFHLLETGVVHDGGQLLGQGGVEGLDTGPNRLGDVLAIGHRALEGLLGQGADEFLGARPLGLLGRGDHLIQQANLWGFGGRGRDRGGFGLRGTHSFSSFVVALPAAWALRSADSFLRSSVFWSTRSRRPSR